MSLYTGHHPSGSVEARLSLFCLTAVPVLILKTYTSLYFPYKVASFHTTIISKT